MDLALIGTVSFGAVWILSFYIKKFLNKELDTTSKLLLMGIIALGLLQVPADLGSKFLNDIRTVIQIVTTATALYQGPKNVMKAIAA